MQRGRKRERDKASEWLRKRTKEKVKDSKIIEKENRQKMLKE